MDYKRYAEIVNQIKKKIDFNPEIALVLGSGLGSFADDINIKYTLNYSDIENFPVSTVSGHKGQFVFGYIGNVPLIIMQGRVHFYEGYNMEQVVIPIRILKMLGVKVVILTNASGGVNYNFNAGDLMLITDHISTFVPNPLIGKNIDEFGPRFPDMSEVYKKDLNDILRKTAIENKIHLKEGIYVQLSGPSYESPAEVRMLRSLGCDAVGMSTVCEAIVANHCGMKVCGISLVTNLASGVSNAPLSHEEVKEAGIKAAPKFKKLLKKAVINIYDKIL
jgi:purine nucleoside phosphorylase I, inosine and guanosine-specific